MKIISALLCLATLIVSGCQSSNHYTETYKSSGGNYVPSHFLPATGTPQLVPVQAQDLTSMRREFERRGYAVIGHAIFTAETDNYTKSLQEQAQAVSAEVVLCITGDAQETMKDVRLNSTSQLTGAENHGNGYITSASSGQGQAANLLSASAKMNSTMPDIIKATVEETTYAAIFMRRRAVVLGANVEPAPLAHGAGTVLAVMSLINGSPAERAGLQIGDIIQSVDGQPVTSIESYETLIDSHAGKIVQLGMARRDTTGVIAIQLNPLP